MSGIHPSELPALPDESPQDDPPPPGVETAPRVAGHAAWRAWMAWAALITGFGITIVGGIIVALASLAFGASLSDSPPGVNVALTVFQNLALIGAALIFAMLAGRPAGDDFGLRPARFWRSVGVMTSVMVAFYAFSLAWGSALHLDEKQTLPDELGVEGSSLNLALVVVLITVVAPIGEELFFRGFFFGALRNWRGWVPAAIITGLIFGAIHIGSSPIGFTVPLAVFGFLLCVLYQRTGSLYPCIALHAANNSLALGLTQKWTWEILPIMVGAVIVSLTLARMFGSALSRRAQSAVAPV